MDNGKVVLAVMAGVAVGAVLGVLFAPDKGTATRKKIVDKKDDTLDGIKDKFSEFLESLQERFESGKEKAQEVMQNGKAKLEHIKEKVDHSEKEMKAKSA